MSKKPILCVDFDGVIHLYASPWTNAHTISDGPVPGALKWLWQATEWFEVVVYSSRSKEQSGREAMFWWMVNESRKEFGADHPMCFPELFGDKVAMYPVKFAAEKPAAFLQIDDRAICFTGDWSALDPVELLKFKPWNKRGPWAPAVEPRDYTLADVEAKLTEIRLAVPEFRYEKWDYGFRLIVFNERGDAMTAMQPRRQLSGGGEQPYINRPIGDVIAFLKREGMGDAR